MSRSKRRARGLEKPVLAGCRVSQKRLRGELTGSGDDTGHAAPQAEDTLGRSNPICALDDAIVDSSRVRVHNLHTGLRGFKDS